MNILLRALILSSALLLSACSQTTSKPDVLRTSVDQAGLRQACLNAVWQDTQNIQVEIGEWHVRNGTGDALVRVSGGAELWRCTLVNSKIVEAARIR